MPVFVLCTIIKSMVNNTAVRAGIITLTLTTEAVCIFTILLNISGMGKPFGLPPKMTIAKFCIKKDAPMALIMIEIFGEWRSGR